MDIQQFRNYEFPTTAHLVGDLIALLHELPEDMEIQQGFNEGVNLLVSMHGDVDKLEFEEIEEEEDE